MTRVCAALTLVALLGVAPFEFQTMPPSQAWGMNITWACCHAAKNKQRGAVVGGYALSLAAPSTGHVADQLLLSVEIQNLGAPTQRLPSVPSDAVFALTVAGPGRSARVWPLRNRLAAFRGFDLPRDKAEQVTIQWFEDYEFFPNPGTYVLRLSTQLLVEGKSVTLSSNDVIVTISAARPGNRFVPTPTPSPTPFTDAVVEQCRVCQGLSRTTPTGNTVDGLALSLTAPDAVVRLGAPLPAIVEVRNVSREVKYVFFGFRNADYDFEVRDVVTGKVVPPDPGARLIQMLRIPVTEPLPPGQSLFGWIDINHIYPIKGAGTYRIRVTRGQPALQPGHSGPWKRLQLDSQAMLVRVVAQ
ncbi:MAG TPA: hypothetical protein VKR56_01860 [Candidatus Cybelea sp.]|nr:hypothetical protein [Candidatus Cybelea sp.]